MARVTVEDCLEHVVDQFALVHLAAQRYRQLHRGAPRLVDNRNKNIVCALREIAGEKVRFREDISEVVYKTRGKLVSQRFQQMLDRGLAEHVHSTAVAPEPEADAPTPLI